MKNLIALLSLIVFNFFPVNATVFYEGTATFCKYGRIGWSWMQPLLPSNPIIVDIGAYYGLDTCYAARTWPEAKIFAIEANPRAYVEMIKHLAEENCENRIKPYYLAIGDHHGTAPFYVCKGPNGNDISYDHESSLLPPSRNQGWNDPEPIEVPCMTLDEWCQLNNIDHIDLLRLELEGFELQALQCSPNILKTVKLIYIQSFFSSDRLGMTNYFWLKDFLYKSNFVVLAHWYTQGGRGNAVYVTQELFDSLHCQ